MFKTLPESLHTSNGDYFLQECECDPESNFKGWWWAKYQPKGLSMPAEATNGYSWYYLTAMEPTKEEAERELLTKLNHCIKIED